MKSRRVVSATLRDEINEAVKKGESKFKSSTPCAKCGCKWLYVNRSGDCVDCCKAYNKKRYQEYKKANEALTADGSVSKCRKDAHRDGNDTYIGKRCGVCGGNLRDTTTGTCVKDCQSVKPRRMTPAEVLEHKVFMMALKAFA